MVLGLVGCGAAGTADVDQAPPAPVSLSLWVDPVVRGEATRFTVTGAAPGQTVHLGGSVAGPGVGPCVRSVCLDLASPVRLGTAVAGADGQAVVSLTIPAGLAPDEVSLQAVAWGPDSASQVVTVDVVDPGEDAATLLAGASTVAPGSSLPSSLALWHRRAIGLAADADGQMFFAAARVNAGKLLIAGHEGFTLGSLGGRGDDADVIVANALSWMARPGARVGVPSGYSGLRTWLTMQGYVVVTAGPAQLGTVDVWMADTYTDWTPAEDAQIRAFLEGGGGVITGGHAWYWAYSHSEPAAEGYPGNHWLRDTGVLVSTNTTDQASVSVTSAPNRLLNGGEGVEALVGHVTGGPLLSLADQQRAASSVEAVASVVPITWSGFWDRAELYLDWRTPAIPTLANPVVVASEPLDRAWLRLRSAFDRGLPAAELTAHPAANDFPGAVPGGAPRVSRALTVDGDHAGRDPRYPYSAPEADAWRSTGLYAAPGEVVTVTVPPSVVGSGLAIRVGAHSDTLWGKDEWNRVPEITRVWPADATTFEVGGALGGLIYVTVPTGAALGPVSVTIDGAVEAPRFVLGVTTPAQWATARTRGAPWAELESPSFVLTVPSSYLTGLADPTALAQYWEDVLDAEADLAAIPRDRPRAERAVTDRQISAGWMHSGYPFMAHVDSAAEFTTLATLQADGSWGAFHELGHNHQWADWLLPGTTEATCNLWSTYVMETVVGLPARTGHPALDPVERAQRVADYLAGGANFSEWSVWTALETHLQLQEAFGWQFFIDLNALYLADAPGSGPSDDQGRIDRFVLRTSQLAGVDLGPFYVAWGFPVSASVLTTVDPLPDWANDPMN
jgi:hypothetical protein